MLLKPKVKVKFRHETLKPQPLNEKSVTSKPLWRLKAGFSGALCPCSSKAPAAAQVLPLEGQLQMALYSSSVLIQYHAAFAGLTDHESGIPASASHAGA